MGHSYSNGLLCCDICGYAGGVKRYPCPFGYCKRVAACEKCRKMHTKQFSKKHHRTHKCEANSIAFNEKIQKETNMITAGKPVRCSAKTIDTDTVHVLFRTTQGTTGRYMTPATYHSIGLGSPATPDDFAAHGTIVTAPDTFFDGSISKNIAIS